MKVFIVIENFGGYALGRGQTMARAVVGVFRDKEKAFEAAEDRARFMGDPQTIRLRGKYVSCPRKCILFEIIPCRVRE